MARKPISKKSLIQSEKPNGEKVNGNKVNSIAPSSTDTENEVTLSIKVRESQLENVVNTLVGISPDIEVNKTDANERIENQGDKALISQPPPTILRIDNGKYLTPREVDVLNSLTKGRINKEIADDLKLKETTIKNYLENIYKKFGVNNRTEANNMYLFLSGRLNPIN